MGKVLSKFDSQPVSMATNFMLQKLVGRVVPASANAQPMYAPGSGKSCVYYKIEIEEAWKVTEIDDETGTRSTREEWETILEDEQCRDFYLQDGGRKIFVNGSNRDACKIQAQEEESDLGGWFTFKEPPPGVRALVGHRRPDFHFSDADYDGDVEMRYRTGEIRYTEKAFDVNEILACLGVPVPANDPFTGEAVQILQPANENSLTDEYFETAGWSDFDKKSWHSLLGDQPAVLLSDNEDFTSGVNVMPAPNLQPWMVQPLTPQLIIAQPNLYQPMPPVVIAPVVVANPIMPGAVIAPVSVQPSAVNQVVPSA